MLNWVMVWYLCCYVATNAELLVGQLCGFIHYNVRYAVFIMPQITLILSFVIGLTLV